MGDGILGISGQIAHTLTQRALLRLSSRDYMSSVSLISENSRNLKTVLSVCVESLENDLLDKQTHPGTKKAVHLTSSPRRDAGQAALASRTLQGELEAVQRGDGREHTGVAVQTGWRDSTETFSSKLFFQHFPFDLSSKLTFSLKH